jgi:hypothetical protein
LVASVAVTALQLDSISQAHWVIRGLWVSSLVLGLLVVYYASSQRKTIGRLLRPQQIRDWMSAKKDIVLGHNYQSVADNFPLLPVIPFPATVASAMESDIPTDDFRYKNLPSVSSVILISSPRLALSYSVNSFVAGLGVYLGFTWRRDLDKGSGDNGSRNVFIFYVVVIVICNIFYYQVYLVHATLESYSKQDKVLATLRTLRKDTLRKTGCSTTSQYRQWRDQNQLRRINDGEDVDVENVGAPSQSIESRSTTKPGHTTVKEKEPEDSLPTSTDHAKQEPGSLGAILRQSAQLPREQAKVQELLARQI